MEIFSSCDSEWKMSFDSGLQTTVIRSQVSNDPPTMVKETRPPPAPPPPLCVCPRHWLWRSVFFTVYDTHTGVRAGDRVQSEWRGGCFWELRRRRRTGIELLRAQTMARYGPCILRNWMMKEGPPATICGGRWLRGQFSMLMMDSLLQRASSNGRLCRFGLSLRYSSSKFSSVPEERQHGC